MPQRLLSSLNTVNHPRHTHIHTHPGLNPENTPQERRRRLQCAFALAEEASGGRRGSKQIKHMDDADATAVMTAADAYPPELACRMWEVLKPAATSLGYGLPEGITEGECQRVVQGARRGA